MIDTGSPINIIDELTYEKLKPQPTLEKCNTNYFGYTATTPMAVLRRFVARVQSKDQAVAGGFVVVKGRHVCLLSCATAKRLGLVTIDHEQSVAATVRAINIDESSEDEWPISKLKSAFPSLFSEKLECLRGQVPIHLQDAVTKKIRKQVDEGILEKVRLDSVYVDTQRQNG
jgi:hypothetical protein